MLDRISLGRVPPKAHLVFRSERGELLYEECITRAGFDGPFSIVYHERRPHEANPTPAPRTFVVPRGGREPSGLARRHYRCDEIRPAHAPIEARIPLLYSDAVVIGFCRPSASDPVYFVNADADDLFFIQEGSGKLRSIFGDLPFRQGDYVCVPKGILHRWCLDESVSQAWLSIECKSALSLPHQYRNCIGQLRMDAPYSHRDFRRPEFVGPVDEHIRDVVVKRGGLFFGFHYTQSPLDVVGWDGAVYPFSLSIHAFAPRVGKIHLPPPVHATFEAEGALVCSFVPRPLDFHEAANPCPYPHSSVDIDEVLFYVNGAFGSRCGIRAGSLSYHPAGIPHGPHPNTYEQPKGSRTDELAVMVDCVAPLAATDQASLIEDPEYHASFRSNDK